MSSRVLRALAAAPAHAPALGGCDAPLSYGALAAEVERLAACLRQDTAGTLALAAENGPAWAVADLAALAARRPLLPLPGFFTPAQRRHALRDAGAGWLLSDDPARDVERFPGALAQRELTVAGRPLALLRLATADPGRLPPGTAKVTYTSGTTGAAKGVCLAQAALEAVAASLARVCRLTPRDIHLAVLPLPVLLENVAGLYAALLAGGRCVIESPAEAGLRGSSGFDPQRLLAALHRHRASTLILTPQMLHGLVRALEAGAPLPGALRFAAVGGAAVSPTLLARAAAAGLPVFEGYGLSECASVVALNVPGAARPGSVGRALPHVALRLAADGEALVSGPGMLGYAGCPGSARDPWPSGDIGRLDADGYLWLEGRRKAMFITAFGRNVAPEWVESELVLQPGIAQAAVFGEARPFPCAVVAMAGADSPGARARVDAAIARANAALPDYARVGAWIPADRPFTPATGELTANGRLCRDRILARYRHRIDQLYAEEPMSFYQELLAATERERQELLAIPFIRDGAAGRLSRRDYTAFLGEAYHHVKHTLPLLMACGARLPERLEWLRAAMGEYVAEETGHHEWILADIAACGGDPEAVRAGRPALPVELMTAYAWDCVQRGNPVGFLGMVLVLEGTSTAVASQAARALQPALGLGPQAFTYLSSHGALDVEHTRFYGTLVDRLDDAGERETLVHCARVFYRLYGDMFRELDARRGVVMARAAA